jgi:hypothetical protein
MRREIAAVALVACTLFAGPALAQEKGSPLPLARFVEVFTDIHATSAQKDVALPEGTWYRGEVTVSDVELYNKQGAKDAFAEIKDWNYTGGCYLLLFRTRDIDRALKLRVGDKVAVQGRLVEHGIHVGKFVSNCETRFAVFADVEIQAAATPGN